MRCRQTLSSHTASHLSLGEEIAESRKKLVARHVPIVMAAAGTSNRLRSVFIDDEIGYLSFEGAEANLSFKVGAKRYVSGAIVLASKLPFSALPHSLRADTDGAMLHRILHRAHLVQIAGESHRMTQGAWCFLPLQRFLPLQQQALRLIEQAGARQHPRTRKAHQRKRTYQRRISGNVSRQQVKFVPGPRIAFR